MAILAGVLALIMKPIGQRLRSFRETAGLTQDDLAARMQARGHETVVRQRIGDMETGKRTIRPEELISLARCLRIPISTLLGVPDFDR